MAAEDEEMAAELAAQLASVERRLAELEEARLFSGEYDAGDAVVTVHAGAGGTDSQDWAEILLRMYLRWAERRGFEVEMKEASPGEEAGLKSATFIARGENAYGLFAAERGVHRLVRISPFDSSSRRHTSFAQVDVGPLVDEGVEVEIDDADLRVDTYRASGAGGQHVNKTDSAVRITHIPTGVVVQCQNERSQTQNKAVAMQFLRSKLIELEERKRAEELAKARGEVKDVAWGSQIRSYFLHPYQRVKDHRTEHEVGRRPARPRRRPRRVHPRLPEQDRRLFGLLMATLDYLERPAAAAPEGLLILHHGRGTDAARPARARRRAGSRGAAAGGDAAGAAEPAGLPRLPLVSRAAGRLSRPRQLPRRPRGPRRAPRPALGGDRRRPRGHRPRRLLDGRGDELRDGSGRRPPGAGRHPRLRRLRPGGGRAGSRSSRIARGPGPSSPTAAATRSSTSSSPTAPGSCSRRVGWRSSTASPTSAHQIDPVHLRGRDGPGWRETLAG